MARERPVLVLVFGILNIVFGTLALCGLGCCGFLLVVFRSATQAGGPGAPPPFSTGLVVAMALFLLAMFVVAGLAIVGGIGLVMMQPWGRYCSILFGTGGILLPVGWVLFLVAVLNPALNEWNEEAKLGRRAPTPQPTAPPSFVSTAYSVIGTVLTVGYSVAVLLVMYLPPVLAEFDGRPAPRQRRGRYREEDDEDEDDRPRPGRRRRFEDDEDD